MRKDELRIMLVSQFYPEVGGIQSWAHGYIEYCKENNIPLFCVDSSLLGRRGIDSNDRINIFDELKRSVSIWKNIKKGIVEFKPNVVHFNSACSPKGLIRDLISINILVKREINIVFHCHCNISDQINRSKLGLYCLNKIVSKVNKVLVLNKTSKDFVYDSCNKEALQVPNYIDESIIENNKEIRENIETILFVGHIRRTKGIQEILNVSKEFPDIKFRLVGPIIEKDLLSNLPNVIFVGPLSHDEVLKEMENADLFVFPSYTEGFSVSILEAMAKGLPVIATDVGANKETLEDCGVIANLDDLAVQINKLNSKTTREEMSKVSIMRVKKNYTGTKVLRRIMEVY